MSWISRIARADIVALQAYEHAAWEPGLERLHANESPWPSLAAETGAGLNRYPEPQPRVLLERLAQLYGVTPGRILVGRGSDEAIDVLTRGFCRAGQDAVIICPPTFGMYAIAARIQGARVLSAPLRGVDFALDAEAVLDRWTPEVKLVFLCSPNNPTGNLLSEAPVLQLARALTEKALVVVDEAYLEFSCGISLARHLEQLPNLAILRTLSKAHALAGARCGALLAHPEVIALLRKVIPPYAIAQSSLEAVINALDPIHSAESAARIERIRAERERMFEGLRELRGIEHVWASQANFLLARFEDPGSALSRARGARLLIRDVGGYPGLNRCLRITIGTREQDTRLLESLQ